MSRKEIRLPAPPKTGWPPGLLQDDDSRLSKWFASRPGARRLVDMRCREIKGATNEQA